MNILREYLERILPWTGDDASSLKIAMTPFTGQDGGKGMWHPAARDLAIFENILYTLGRKQDVWAATGVFNKEREATSRGGWLKATRTGQNLSHKRCVYLDVDAKPGESDKYQTVAEAEAALNQFIADTQLPPTTLRVMSGGGVHAYWCVDENLPPDRWQRLAFALDAATKHWGLKCDSQCTVDAVRVLRPPGTFNFKYDPPRPVQMQPPGPVHTVAALEAALSRFQGPRLVHSALPQSPQQAPATGVNANFIANTPAESLPVDLWQVAEAGCDALMESLNTGGAGHSQPRWHLDILMATFDQNPQEAAHALSDGHASYTAAETDAMLLRKQAERAAKNLGWPSCNAVAVTRAACMTCPHFGAQKSPLNLMPRPAPPSSGPTPAQAVMSGDLPAGYWRHANGCIHAMIEKKKANGEAVSFQMQILDYDVRAGRLRSDTGSLVFEAVVNHNLVDVEISAGALASAADCTKAMAKSNMLVSGAQQAPVKEFIVAWAKKLQDMKHIKLTPMAMGWHGKEFTFDGKTFTANGAVTAFQPESHRLPDYGVKGELKVWMAACLAVNSMKNPALDCIIGTSFAAPLVAMTGQRGVIYSTFSPESGRGKTTALSVAQGVWGHPVTGMGALSDTENYIMRKIGVLRNLPYYWDELKTKSEIDKFISIVFRLGQGKDKGRLNRDSSLMEPHDFSTMVATGANDSIADRINHATRNTAAGAVRCFEVVAPESNVRLDQIQLQIDIAKLNHNYGAAGVLYADYLARNYDSVNLAVQTMQKDLAKLINVTTEERFWLTTISTILVGAAIANTMQLTNCDLPAMRNFLLDAIKHMRGERTDAITDLNVASDAEGLLQALLQDTLNKHLLITDIIHSAPGRPAPGSVALKPPFDRVQSPWVQYAVDTGEIRVASEPFTEWLLTHRKLSPSIVLRSLAKHMQVVKNRAGIGVGTSMFGDSIATLRTRVIDITLPAGMRPLIDGAAGSGPDHPPNPGSA